MSRRGREGGEVDGMHGDDREKKKHNGKEGRGQQFPSTNFSSVLTVCAEQRASQAGHRCILNILKGLTCVQTNTVVLI